MTAEEYARMQALAATLPKAGMGFDYGGAPVGEQRDEGWTSYRTLPGAVGEYFTNAIGPMVRVGEGLRGLRSYDRLEDLEADVLSAVGTVATPVMAFSRPGVATVGALGSGLINKVQGKFRSAYDAAREVQNGSSFVDIAVLRDNLGLSQEKMAGLLKRAQREGHAVLEKGEQSVVGDYLKGGAVDGKLLVRLDPEFFDNIGSYISGEAKRAVDGLVGVDTYEKFNKTVLKDLELNE